MKLRSGITLKFAFVFVLFALLLLASMSVLFYFSGRAALEAATISELRATAIEKEATLDAWIAERKSDTAALAQSPGLRQDVESFLTAPAGSPAHALAENNVRQELQTRAGPDQVFSEVFILEPAHAQILFSTRREEEGKFREDLPYFIEGRRAPYVQNIYYSFALQGAAMTASAPLRAANGELLGVLAARLNLDEMTKVINRRSGLHTTDDFFLVTAANLFASQPRFISDPAVLQRGIYTPAVKQCLTRTSGTIAANDYRGEPVLAVYRWLEDAQLCLITKLDQAEAFAPVRDLTATLLVVTLVVLGAASALSIIVARTLTQPILALQTSAAKLARGDLSARAPENARDELGALAHEFNVMAAAIAEKDARLQERAAQLEFANKELEAFTYSVSHDLRAPLRAITGFARILLDDYAPQLESETARYLHLIAKNTQQMGRLVDDLLAFSRLGRHALKKETVQPEKIVRRVLADLQSEQENRALEINISVLAPCQADPALLKQVWMNLIANALKFTRTRAPARIEIGTLSKQDAETRRPEDPENPRVAASLRPPVYFIRDNGVGFDMQYAHKLFGVFQRLHRADEFEGTGVGLAIVQRVIHRHGGRVWAESEPEKGATFYFTL